MPGSASQCGQRGSAMTWLGADRNIAVYDPAESERPPDGPMRTLGFTTQTPSGNAFTTRYRRRRRWACSSQ